MTNAEAAAFFASQAPDSQARVAILNEDTGVANIEYLGGLVTEEALENIDDGADDVIGLLFVSLKW